MKHEESRIQEVVVSHIRKNWQELLITTSPAAMKMSMPQALRMKRMGYTHGTPDLMIFRAKKEYLGLFIELKTEKGKPSAYQKEFNSRANSEGYKAVVCYGAAEAIATIEEYLK